MPVLRIGLGDMADDLSGSARVGREAFIRSCALRILEAATISIALVIFCVLHALDLGA
jgi:hypothetical protein